MKNCKLYIVTFVITALWDVVLRIMVENYDKLPKLIKLDFMEYLIPYFQKHTLNFYHYYYSSKNLKAFHYFHKIN